MKDNSDITSEITDKDKIIQIEIGKRIVAEIVEKLDYAMQKVSKNEEVMNYCRKILLDPHINNPSAALELCNYFEINLYDLERLSEGSLAIIGSKARSFVCSKQEILERKSEAIKLNKHSEFYHYLLETPEAIQFIQERMMWGLINEKIFDWFKEKFKDAPISTLNTVASFGRYIEEYKDLFPIRHDTSKVNQIISESHPHYQHLATRIQLLRQEQMLSFEEISQIISQEYASDPNFSDDWFMSEDKVRKIYQLEFNSELDEYYNRRANSVNRAEIDAETMDKRLHDIQGVLDKFKGIKNQEFFENYGSNEEINVQFRKELSKYFFENVPKEEWSTDNPFNPFSMKVKRLIKNKVLIVGGIDTLSKERKYIEQ